MRLALAAGMCGSFPGTRGELVTLFGALFAVAFATMLYGTESQHFRLFLLSPETQMA